MRSSSSRPVEDGPWPGVVMLHEAFGIDDVAAPPSRSAGLRRLPGATRRTCFGEGFRLGCMISTIRVVRRPPRPALRADRAVRRFWPAVRDCTGRVGVIGFCLGGGFALLVAGRGFDAAAVNYGQIPADVDDVLRGSCPIVASYGERDGLLSQVPRLEAALVTNDIPNDLKTYPTAGHSFLNDEPNGPRSSGRWLRRRARRTRPGGGRRRLAADRSVLCRATRRSGGLVALPRTPPGKSVNYERTLIDKGLVSHVGVRQ